MFGVPTKLDIAEAGIRASKLAPPHKQNPSDGGICSPRLHIARHSRGGMDHEQNAVLKMKV